MIPVRVPLTIPNRIPVPRPGWLPYGCRVWYAMDEAAGSVLTDLSGNGIDGTVTGAVWASGPRDGNVLSFNGTSTRVNLALVMGGVDHSYEFWVAPTSTGAIVFLFECETTRQIIRIAADRTTNVWQSGAHAFTPVLADGVWAHVCYVLANGALPIMYVNGVPFTEAVNWAGAAVGGQVKVGSAFGGLVSFYKGLMGGFRAYDRAVSAVEVSTLFDAERARYGI